MVDSLVGGLGNTGRRQFLAGDATDPATQKRNTSRHPRRLIRNVEQSS